MATTDTASRGDARRRLLLTVLTVLAVGVLLTSRSPSQMGADEEVFRTVDALFTAVTARDENLLGQCEGRLRSYREAGKLPGGAAKSLERIVATARGGSWQSAAETLYDFMKGQRREGKPGSSAKAAKK